jgi:hypothetical protein
MATGRNTQLTKQIGEYLVAAEACRRGLIATTFTGNVPDYDIIATNGKGSHQAIQVKAINGKGSWQFDSRYFMDIRLEGKKQIIEGSTKAPLPNLVFVFVLILEQSTDEFFILNWKKLQKIAIAQHQKYLDKHSGIRPKKYDSYHMAIGLELLKDHRDKWECLQID